MTSVPEHKGWDEAAAAERALLQRASTAYDARDLASTGDRTAASSSGSTSRTRVRLNRCS